MVRHKNRYIVVEIRETFTKKNEDSPLQLHPAALHGAIFGQVEHLHGDFGVAAIRAGFVAKYCNPHTRIAIIRTRHGPHRLVASAIPYIKYIDKVRAYITTLYTAATIKHGFKFIKNYQQVKFDEYCLKLKSDEEKEQFKKLFMNLDPMLTVT